MDILFKIFALLKTNKDNDDENKVWNFIKYLLLSISCMILIGFPYFKSTNAIIKCANVDIPKEITLIQSDSYCSCMNRIPLSKYKKERPEIVKEQTESCIQEIQYRKERAVF